MSNKNFDYQSRYIVICNIRNNCILLKNGCIITGHTEFFVIIFHYCVPTKVYNLVKMMRKKILLHPLVSIFAKGIRESYVSQRKNELDNIHYNICRCCELLSIYMIYITIHTSRGDIPCIYISMNLKYCNVHYVVSIDILLLCNIVLLYSFYYFIIVISIKNRSRRVKGCMMSGLVILIRKGSPFISKLDNRKI